MHWHLAPEVVKAKIILLDKNVNFLNAKKVTKYVKIVLIKVKHCKCHQVLEKQNFQKYAFNSKEVLCTCVKKWVL